jgi:hypothetical protein
VATARRKRIEMLSNKRRNLKTVEIDDGGDAVRFGRWHAPISIRRDFDLRAGKEVGLIVEIGGGACDGPYMQELLLPPGAGISEEEVVAIRGRIAQDVAEVTRQFMAELARALERRAQAERKRLEGI